MVKSNIVDDWFETNCGPVFSWPIHLPRPPPYLDVSNYNITRAQDINIFHGGSQFFCQSASWSQLSKSERLADSDNKTQK